jgi:hypothetical protein
MTEELLATVSIYVNTAKEVSDKEVFPLRQARMF